MIRARQRAVLLFAVLLVALFGVQPAAAEDAVEFTIGSSEITESSGLARDANGERFWTTNDSGAEGILYALSDHGKVQGTLRFRADPVDVEAVAMVGNRLFAADIGDNKAKRDFVTIYEFENPTAQGLSVQYKAYDFRYPDGPRNAETLLVDQRGQIYLVTKEAKAGIYAAPAQPSRQGVNDLTRVGDAPAFVTDGTFLPGDDKIALRTYVSIEVLDALTYDTVAKAAAPVQPQGESITLSLDGESLLLGSEGKKSKVYSVPIPEAVDAAPTAGANPPDKENPAPSEPPGGTEAEPTPEVSTNTDGKSRRGTFLALGLAGLVSIVAGAVVFLVRPGKA